MRGRVLERGEMEYQGGSHVRQEELKACIREL